MLQVNYDIDVLVFILFKMDVQFMCGVYDSNMHLNMLALTQIYYLPVPARSCVPGDGTHRSFPVNNTKVPLISPVNELIVLLDDVC